MGGGGVGGEGGGLSPYFNSNPKRVLAGKHLPCSSATPIHIGPVSVSRYTARLRAIGADLGTGH